MEWVKYRSQILLLLKKHVLRKDAHGSSSGSCRREFFQTTADRRSHVEYCLKWMSTKMSILNNQRTAPAFKTAAVKQIDPQVEMYIKRLKQLPPSLSVDADPKELREALANQEEDLVTPVQQKLLKRLLHKGKEPRPPVKKAPASKRIPAPVVKKTPAVAIPVEHAAITPPPPPPLPPPSILTPPPSPVRKRKSSWDELPCADGGNEPDFQDAITRTMKKIKRTPQYVKNLRRTIGWESWVPTGKSKARRSSRRKKSSSVLKTLGSAAKDLVVAGASAGRGRTKRTCTRKKKGLLGAAGSLAKQLILDD